MTREIEVAKSIIIAYLSTNVNLESAREIYEITHDNKKVWYNHIEALADIFTTAKEQLKEELLEKESEQ